MAGHAHRRQVLLFLAAILLPCAALVVLGVRLSVQEQELARARLRDERQRIASALRQELSAGLERLALRQADAVDADPDLLLAAEYGDSAVALVAAVLDGRLVLPWEQDPAPAEVRLLLDEGPFAERIRAGTRAEFGASEPARAAELYRHALAAAERPVQVAYARLSLARSLVAAGRSGAAVSEYRAVEAAPRNVVDDSGVPLSLYAASRLLELGVADTAFLERAADLLPAERWLSPPALYLLRDLVERFLAGEPEAGLRRAAGTLARDVADRLGRTEHALRLKRVFPSLGLMSVDGAPTEQRRAWVLDGSPPWLVGVAPVAEGHEPLVLAVRAEPILASLEARSSASGGVLAEVAAATGGEADSEPLGVAFPGLSVRFTSPDGTAVAAVGTARWWFYMAGLSLVLGFTLFGAYLLWRDVRREVELAETRSHFVSAVSHELKTPLSAIRMFAETLQMGRPADPGARREYLDTIVNESERLTRLLNNVLEFSRIEQGRKVYRRGESHALDEIVRSSARAMGYPLEQGRFALRLEVEEDVPPARVDRDAIEQAILNLLTNAMKYSGESREIELRLAARNGEAVIEVTDGGVGIEPGERERIFERFYRIGSQEDDGVPGTGLGLTLVRHIAEAHDGRVTVRSQPGEGSTFSLFIPLEANES